MRRLFINDVYRGECLNHRVVDVNMGHDATVKFHEFVLKGNIFVRVPDNVINTIILSGDDRTPIDVLTD